MASATRRRLVKVLLLSAAGVVLSGCGQKGPLYLPDETQEKKKKEKTSAREPRIPPRV
jgi:predicted small lipoprotein YifL